MGWFSKSEGELLIAKIDKLKALDLEARKLQNQKAELKQKLLTLTQQREALREEIHKEQAAI